MVIEGPSGIGKTCAVMKALNQLNKFEEARKLSARKTNDLNIIDEIINEKLKGLIIIDDFHRLPNEIKNKIADYLKTLADEEVIDTKIIVVGINRAGDTLIKFAKDLVNRIDIIRFETNPPEKLIELVKKGEKALNINIKSRNEIAQESHGSFYLAQMLAHETCLKAGILEHNDSSIDTNISIEVVRQSVYDRLSLSFSDIVKTFITGPKLRHEGRAPYLHILRWLADSDAWSVSLKEEVRKHPEARGSVGQVVEKGYLKKFSENHPEFRDVLNYDDSTNILTAEDPQFIFYIRNINWGALSRQIGFKNINFASEYDFALSFSGDNRDLAEKVFLGLTKNEISVFYDMNEQHKILAENIEDYLGPIYKSQAKYVVCFLSSTYPTRIWAKFESEKFKSRFGEHSVIPIIFRDAPLGIFDETSKVGGFIFDPSKDADSQVNEIVSLLTKKLAE